MNYKGKSDKDYNTVYKYTNMINGKVYVGRTMRTLIERAGKNGNGYKTCSRFYEAICKYGWDNFKLEILAEGVSLKDGIALEKYYINLYRSNEEEYGYNILSQEPNTGRLPESTKGKIRDSRARLTKEQRENISVAHMGQKAWNKGIKTGPMSKEAIRNMIDSRKNGNATKAILVRNVETGEMYNSLNSAGRAYGCASKTIAAAIRRGSVCKGYHFEAVCE